MTYVEAMAMYTGLPKQKDFGRLFDMRAIEHAHKKNKQRKWVNAKRRHRK